MGRIRQRVGSTVKYTYPDGTEVRGKIRARVFFPPEPRKPLREIGGDYRYFIDRIEFEHGEEIRLGYYRRPSGGGDADWKFAGQTTISAPKTTLRALLKAGIAEPWLRQIIAPIAISAARTKW